MEEDKEIDMLQIEIQQLINRCIILNKDEMTATARVTLGRDIELRFRKILQENFRLKYLYEKTLNDLVKADKRNIDIIKNSVSKDKIKEIVDECIPRGKNIITKEEEYQPNANANSYLTQTILELLEGDE